MSNNNDRTKTVRISEDLEAKLDDAAAKKRVQVSDYIRRVLQNAVDEPAPAAGGLPIGMDAQARLQSKLDAMHRLQSHAEILDHKVEENGGKPRFFSSGAPKHMLEAQAAVKAALDQLTLDFQALKREIEGLAASENS
jgi:hypothetical protein